MRAILRRGLCAVIPIIAACTLTRVELGGAGATDAGDDGPGATSDGGNADAPWSPICPIGVPDADTPCSVLNLRCEYGDSPQPDCNTIAYCALAPLRFMVGGPDKQCPLPVPTNPAACAGSYGAISTGTACAGSGVTIGTECRYPEGTCLCGLAPDNGKWRCTPQPSGCPASAPRFGTACSPEGVQCDYHGCTRGGATAFCQHGVWNGGGGGCLLPGGGDAG